MVDWECDEKLVQKSHWTILDLGAVLGHGYVKHNIIRKNVPAITFYSACLSFVFNYKRFCWRKPPVQHFLIEENG